MKRPKLFLRLAAVCFSMLLIGGYVYLRAGGDQKIFSGSKSDRVLPGSKSAGVAAPALAPTTTAVLPGSKGGAVVLPGSKSFTIIPATTQPAGGITLTTQPTLDSRAIIYSSKSAPVLLPSQVKDVFGVAATQPAPSAAAPSTKFSLEPPVQEPKK